MRISQHISRMVKNQVGFTAVELLIGVALIGIIGGAVGVTVAQTFSGSGLSSQQMTAINNVRNAGDWIMRDVQQSRPKESVTGSGTLVSTATPPDNQITLIWYDYTNYPTRKWYRVIYTITGTDLQRAQEIGVYSNGLWTKDVNEPTQSIVVARNITAVTRQFAQCIMSTGTPPVCQKEINTLTITITSTVGKALPESRTFEIQMRPRR